MSAISEELYHDEDALPTSLDLLPHGHEIWISDTSGGVIHLDLRQDKSKARRYQLSEDKIGCVSVNPVNTNFLLTTSNSRVLRYVFYSCLFVAFVINGSQDLGYTQTPGHIR